MAQVNSTLQEPLTPQEKKFYGSIFKTLDPKNSGLISGGVAKPLLEASGLPLSVLGEIWNLSDSDNTGFLNQFGFCVAMRLIAHAQKGEQLTSSTANFNAPLAKFGTIQVNNTGSGVLKSHLQPGTGLQPSAQPRVASSNSINSHSSTGTVSTPGMIVPLLSSVQATNFGAMFDKTAVGGVLLGAQARNIFLKARLPIPTLEQIWNLVDQNENGQLTRPQFIVAMHLIQCFMNKSLTILPSALSDQLWKVAENAAPVNAPLAANLPSPSPSSSPLPTNPPSVPLPRAYSQPVQSTQQQPQQSSNSHAIASSTTNLNTWIMSNEQRKQYGAIFDTLDTKHQTYISSSTVANFLITSKLPNQVLANIWELANLDHSDNFTKQEFLIAMYLVQKKLAGYELPDETPAELIQSSTVANSIPIENQQNLQPPQSFASAKAHAAPQRTPSHMDDLLSIFQTASPVPPAAQTGTIAASPASPAHAQPPPVPHSRTTNFTGSNFVPSSNFGRDLQTKSGFDQGEDEESSDDDEGPENLDLPRIRGAPPTIPGRSNKPNFDSEENVNKSVSINAIVPPTSNYDAIKSVANEPPVMFSNSAATPANSTAGFTNNAANVASGFTNTAATTIGAATGAAIGFTGAAAASVLGGFSNSSTTPVDNTREINDQITQTSVDIANYSNQVNSLSKQTAVVTSKKEKAQNDLNKILKSKETILGKLNQLKELHENETRQVLEVQNLVIKAKAETDSLENELSIAEANYHAEQTKKEQLQVQYDESQKSTQTLKEQLGTFNAEAVDLNTQIEELTAKLKQSNNLLAVTQQQVATQDAQNEELRQKVSELNNTIFQIDSKHQLLLQKINELNDENLELQEKHTDLSIESADKNVEYSNALSAATSKGLITGSDLEKFTDGGNEEVPTASLDDFNDVSFGDDFKAPSDGLKNEAVAAPAPDSPQTNTDTSMSKQPTEATPLTQEGSENLNSDGVERQQFSLPFAIPHSETSSTQNNPSQSARDDLNVSSSSTIDETAPLSSQVLPEGAISESGRKNSGSPKNESFEFINHPSSVSNNLHDASAVPVVAAAAAAAVGVTATAAAVSESSKQTSTFVKPSSISGNTSEVETLSDAPQERQTQVPELDEFLPIKELEPLDDDSSSSSDDDYQDASVVAEKETAKKAVEQEKPTADTSAATTNNPFNNQQNSNKQAIPETGPSMFDDLGLETAQIEDSDAAFDSVDNSNAGFSNSAFTFANNDVAASGTSTTPGTGDDWEQVFAGFGNDPNLQPASVEEDATNTSYDSHFPQPAVFGFSASNPAEHTQGFSNNMDQTIVSDIARADAEIHSAFTEPQKLAIEELSDMGFDREDAIGALKIKNWNIDDASNYLLDKA